MRRSSIAIVLCLLVFVPCRRSAAILVTMNTKDIAGAIEEGRAQGIRVTKYIKQNYKFGEEHLFEESGLIRTKWTKLMVLSGLLASKDKKITDQEKERIAGSTNLQIDLYTYGNRINFADSYSIQVVQKDKTIEPEKIAVDHVIYRPEKKFSTSGFPRYRATLRSFFSYNEISPIEKAEIILLKDKKKVVFQVNFADYK